MRYYVDRIQVFLIAFALGVVGFQFGQFAEAIKWETDVSLPTILPVGHSRFTKTYRTSLIKGYVQEYVTDDGFELTEGNNCGRGGLSYRDDKREISYVFNVESDRRRYYSIESLENTHCITAPTYELALELRNYLKGIPGEDWNQ